VGLIDAQHAVKSEKVNFEWSKYFLLKFCYWAKTIEGGQVQDPQHF
jgi:hypothetical protein